MTRMFSLFHLRNLRNLRHLRRSWINNPDRSSNPKSASGLHDGLFPIMTRPPASWSSTSSPGSTTTCPVDSFRGEPMGSIRKLSGVEPKMSCDGMTKVVVAFDDAVPNRTL